MDYEINRETLAIIPINENESKILENNDDYIIPKSTLEVMEHSCEYFGSTYDGRLKASKNMLGTFYKVPIIIEESNEIIFFPIKSNGINAWISLKNILKYERLNDKCLVTFIDGKTLILDINCSSFENQVFRAARLENILHNRKSEKNKKND